MTTFDFFYVLITQIYSFCNNSCMHSFVDFVFLYFTLLLLFFESSFYIYILYMSFLPAYICMYITSVPGDCGGQNKEPDPRELELWVVSGGCWELNSGPLQKQQVLLTPNHLSSPPISLFS